jgi:muscarinic acetylcholine receptor M3
MIASAWGISLLLWPPWIIAWPYIEGKRTVPETDCYIQFIETNHYITFGKFRVINNLINAVKILF